MPWSVSRLTAAGRGKLASARRSARRPQPDGGESDAEFLDRIYPELLGRPIDAPGKAHFLAAMRDGLRRKEVEARLRMSDEYIAHQSAGTTESSLPSLLESDPERYAVERSTGGEDIAVFRAGGPDDFDWIAGQIDEHDYYEQPGIWTLGVDLDKQVMGELIALLGSSDAIEFGCSSGSVLACLLERGVDAHGIDISEYARDRATEQVRTRIHIGDVRTLPIERRFGLGFGLDIFEHINPNEIDAVIKSFIDLLTPDAYVFANIPAFGDDVVFGEVFPMFLPSWQRDAARGELFSSLQVDGRGFPMHGHLVWAATPWWVDTFERQGLRRAPEIEREIHRIYDWYFEQASPARRSFFVFTKGAPANHEAIVERCRSAHSDLLDGVRAEWIEAGMLG